MTLTFVLLAELLLLAWATHRSGFMPFPHGFMIYIMFAQIFLWLNAFDIVYYEFLHLWTSGAYRTHFQSVVLIFFMFYLGATACVPGSRVNLSSLFAGLRQRDETGVVSILLITPLYVHLALYWLHLDWSVAWQTDRYLQMGNPADQGLVGTVLMQSERVFGMLAMILAVYAGYRRRWGALLAVLPIISWHVLFDMAAHSRSVVYYFITGGLTFMALQPRKLTAPALMFGAAMLTLVGSLSGRGSQLHGFSSLPFYFTNMVTHQLEIGNLTNIFEGVFVTSEYFKGGLEYPMKYKLLALSPLFSFMDGYDLVRLQYQIKIHRFVPHGAVTEVLSFGIGYAAVYFAVQFMAGWLSVRALTKWPGLPTLFVNSLFLLAAYLQFTYSTRTVFRFFVAAGIASVILLQLAARRQGARPPDTLAAGGTSAAAPPLADPAILSPRIRRMARAAETTAPPRHALAAVGEARKTPRFSRRAERAARIGSLGRPG